MTPRTASLPVGPCRQGYRKERMEADSPRPRLPRCATNEKIVRYQQPIPTTDTNKGPPRFCPHSPRLRT